MSFPTIIPFISTEEIQSICKHLGKTLAETYADKNPLVIGVLKGSQPFLSDILRNMDIPLEVSYLKIRSYQGTTSTGNFEIQLDTDISLEDREVIIVEDIVDTANTMTHLLDLLNTRNPKSIKVVTLLDKPSRRKYSFTPDYVGKEIDDYFVVGYGLDYNEAYRNLPYIGVLEI